MEGEIVHEEKVKIELLFALYKYDISYSDVLNGFLKTRQKPNPDCLKPEPAMNLTFQVMWRVSKNPAKTQTQLSKPEPARAQTQLSKRELAPTRLLETRYITNFILSI